MHNTGKESNKYNNLLHNVLEEDLGSEMDGLSDISSVGGSERTGVQKASPANIKSSAEESTRKLFLTQPECQQQKHQGRW